MMCIEVAGQAARKGGHGQAELSLNPRWLCPFADVGSSKPTATRTSFTSLRVSIFISWCLDLLVLYLKPTLVDPLVVLLMQWDSDLSLFRVSPRRDDGSHPATASLP